MSQPLSKAVGFGVYFGAQRAPGYMDDNGKPVILLDKVIPANIARAREMHQVSPSIAKSVFFFLHEVGHHHVGWDRTGQDKNIELKANQWAAKNFRRVAPTLGIKPAQVQKLWKMLPDYFRDPTNV